MKKIIVALCFFASLHTYAMSDGLDAQYMHKGALILKKIKDANKIMYDLLAEAEEGTLSKAQENQFVKAVCESLRFDIDLFEYLATDINQARILFEDDQLDKKSLLDTVKDSTEYEIAQQLKGTPDECKYE